MGTRFTAWVVVLALAPWPALGQEAGLRILHTPAQCFVPGRYPEIHARIQPIAHVARARVLFRTAETAEPHAVAMTQSGEEFVAVLPKPARAAGLTWYRVEAVDPAAAVILGDEARVTIGACADRAPSRGKARVEVATPAGGLTVPAGFDEEGVVAEGTPEERHPGVFNLGQGTSLVVALAVGAVAYAGGLISGERTVPARENPDAEPPGVTVADAPASGTSTALDALRITVRVVTRVDAFGSPRLELRQAAGGPLCAFAVAPGVNSVQAGYGQVIAFAPPHATGSCGASFEANAIVFRLTDFLGNDAAPTSLPATPLPLRYTITN